MWNSGEVRKATAFDSRASARIQVSAWAFMLACDRIAPFGLPVVPEVYMISEGVSSGMSSGVCASPSSARKSSKPMAPSADVPPMTIRVSRSGACALTAAASGWSIVSVTMALAPLSLTM